MPGMKELIDRIIARVNINLREPAFDVGPYVKNFIDPEKFLRFYASYGLTFLYPLHFHFRRSILAGSYFLGKCIVDHSIVYKSDIRGDELKSRDDVFRHKGWEIKLHDDETIHIQDSYLIKTLVHNYSHNPESPEEFQIHNVVSMPYANIHGSPIEGGFLGPFATVDVTTVHNCVLGPFSYVQVGELNHKNVPAGQVWVSSPRSFDFSYRFSKEVLERYVRLKAGRPVEGEFVEFAEGRKDEFQKVFDSRDPHGDLDVPPAAHVSRYAVVKGNCFIKSNVLIAQRAYIEDSHFERGANAQENCFIINSRLEGQNVTAHGGKVVHTHLGHKVFVGFNAFLRGSAQYPLTIGDNSIVMPHTIIDIEEPVNISADRLVWGHIRRQEDLLTNSLSFEALLRLDGKFELGGMKFRGSGSAFLNAFLSRIEHILEANGAYFDGMRKVGHAQKGVIISLNTIQPYTEGDMKGIYPTIDIRP